MNLPFIERCPVLSQALFDRGRARPATNRRMRCSCSRHGSGPTDQTYDRGAKWYDFGSWRFPARLPCLLGHARTRVQLYGGGRCSLDNAPKAWRFSPLDRAAFPFSFRIGLWPIGLCRPVVRGSYPMCEQKMCWGARRRLAVAAQGCVLPHLSFQDERSPLSHECCSLDFSNSADALWMSALGLRLVLVGIDTQQARSEP